MNKATADFRLGYETDSDVAVGQWKTHMYNGVH